MGIHDLLVHCNDFIRQDQFTLNTLWTQSVEVNGSTSKWRPVMCGVPQGSILGPVLFNVFIHDTDSETSAHMQMTWSLVVQLTQQRDVIPSRDKFDKGTYKYLMKFKKSKCKVLHLGQARRDMSRCWDKKSLRAALQRRTWRFLWTKSWT